MNRIKTVRIKPYFRKNGIRVKGHTRSFNKKDTEFARLIHAARPFHQREIDDKKNEPLAENLQQWLENPVQYDIKGVDTKILYNSHPVINDGKQFLTINIHNEEGKSIGDIRFLKAGVTKKSLFLDSINTNDNTKIHDYLIREATTIADKNQYNLTIHISHKDYGFDKKNKKWYEMHRNLINYYNKFGFKPSAYYNTNFYDDTILVRTPSYKRRLCTDKD